MKIKLDTKVGELPRVGKILSKKLNKLGLFTVRDLLFYYPFRYQDFSTISHIADIQPNTQITIKGQINLIANKRIFRRKMYITECLITDDTGSMKAVWFNQPFITKMLKQGDTAYFSGKVELTAYGIQMVGPTYEKIKKEQTHTARIVPVYSVTENLTAKQIRYLIKLVLPLARDLPDWIPEKIIKHNKLINLAAAIREVHFPTNKNTLSQARHRLKFNELFLIQLNNQNIRHRLKQIKALPIKFNAELTKKFIASLPWPLTANQKEVGWDILKAISFDHPMNRLLEGDVGSGKTVVATLIMLNVVDNGFQAALMAPTEILAQQHFKTISTILEKFHISLALLTRTNKLLNNTSTTPKKITEAIRTGQAQIIIGTHALIQKKITFSRLGFIVIDEQHRFGVDQRKMLKQKSQEKKDNSQAIYPHLLSMTATPIPRSLALTLYGDLDLSIITQMPQGRKKIITKIVSPDKRQAAYDFIRNEIKKGRQAFVICPLIEESDKLGVRAVTVEYKKLSREIFPNLKVDLLHGKLKADKKESVMQKFTHHETNILVATSVVEVGIDVPNASVMMIEGAERFGLAQLHQFRGRVGRAKHQSYCFIFTDSESAKTLARLQALVTAKNGFELAEMDLEFRGPGEVFGLMQSGFPGLKIAKLTDVELIQQTKKAAEYIFANDANLTTYPQIRDKILKNNQNLHLE
ncbi:ATP-dependent DNA helicase RecG [Patescibacteria group bacterium]|nr:ATP-dependent DNA helicase RecG [Patescibacteria group bacterium]